jgi:hypothetical protein
MQYLLQTIQLADQIIVNCIVVIMCIYADRLWGKIVNAHASGQKWAWVSERSDGLGGGPTMKE